jgi:hypothetical protein
VFKAKCGFFYIKQPIFHLDRDSRENGRLGLKNENPCFENFSEVPGLRFHLGGREESRGFPEVKHSKYKNGFFNMFSLKLNLSGTIFVFSIR